MQKTLSFLSAMKRALLCLLSGAALHSTAQTAGGLAVDVHSHCVLPSYVDFLSAHNALLDEGFALPAWDVVGHLKMMDETGIAWSVLTSPAPQPYFGDGEESATAVRGFNEETAKIKALHPARFKFCATLPLPDVAAAVREAVYALDTLGADGVKLATNAYGQYLGDSVLDPLMQTLDARGAVVILHPHKPTPVNGDLMAGLSLGAYEYPAETTRALVNLIVHNVPARFPNIKFVVPHCGSFLPLALPRLQNVMALLQASGQGATVDWAGNLKNFYYDLAGGLTPDVLATLRTITTTDHLLYGSDYPYVKATRVKTLLNNAHDVLTRGGLTPEEIEDVMHGNAERLFAGTTADDATISPTASASSAGATVSDKTTADSLLMRISEIEVYPEFLEEYLAAARCVGETSVREEPGVVAIVPMIQKRDSCQVRIVEIYANDAAYRHHIATAHFKTYKQGTLHMVKHLDLVDMTPMNAAGLPAVFRKMK